MTKSVAVHEGGNIESTSEAKALASILNWSKEESCPEWQRDAMRRLCQKSELDDNDLNELTTLCKNQGKGGVPLIAEHIPDPDAVTMRLDLRGLHSIVNVNALKEGEHLTFDKTGLTVVYGDNGSGKSGYARILKKVCRARSSQDDRIEPNIYTRKAGPQGAVIDFSANGQKKSAIWTTGKACDPLLTSVSVFDRATANVYVDERNDVAYTPFPMQLLKRLADACQEIKGRINAEILELERQTPKAITAPKCQSDTGVGNLITRLSSETKEEEVRALAMLDTNELTRLATLKTDLSSDPAKAADRIETLKARIDRIDGKFAKLLAAVCRARSTRLGQLWHTFGTARVAATAAASNLFADEPLQDVGSDVWLVLWKAAREYSERQAYPSIQFPVTDGGARCVLCQQELEGEAAKRLSRFERFVTDRTKIEEEEAKSAYQAALVELQGANVSIREIQEVVALVRDEFEDEMLAKRVRKSAVTAKWRLRSILRNHVNADMAGSLPAAEAWPIEEIAAKRAGLQARIVALRAEDESDERKKLRREYQELADRDWLAGIEEDVLAEISRRRKRAKLEIVVRDTRTNRITTKSSEIAEQLVTNALRARFSQEIDKLDVSELGIELRKEISSYGVPLFRVSLTRKPEIRVGNILSEGEHRCVALAAFLAELATSESHSAIVFDDPVSSLDHRHRRAMAVRLAEEAQTRQIVVLTHDIAFLFELEQACRQQKTHVAFRSVTRNDVNAGICQQDPPIRAQKVEKVIDGMQARLDNEKILYESGNQSGWENTVDVLQKRLRVTWERAVEEALGPVLKRLSHKVNTKGLAKIAILTLEDCKTMRNAYGRCSELLHSSPDESNPPLPNPQKVQNEITALRNWMNDIKQRQKDTNLPE